MSATVKAFSLVAGLALLAACAAQDRAPEPSRQDIVQAVRDFIDVRDLVEIDELKTSTRDSWDPIDEYFLIYKGRRDTYLVEFNRRCYELNDNTRIVADRRYSTTEIRARFDTIRGCRIDKIYALTPEEATELENIGESPGSRN
jgi:hypothetical protein